MPPYNFIRFTRFFITQRFKVSRITDKTYLSTAKISGFHHPSAALYRYYTAQKRHTKTLSSAHGHPHIFTLKPAENNKGHPSCASTEMTLINYLSVPPVSTRHTLFRLNDRRSQASCKPRRPGSCGTIPVHARKSHQSAVLW